MDRAVNEYCFNYMYTWLDDGVVSDFKCGYFLFRRYSCIPEHLHFLFRSLSVRKMERKKNTWWWKEGESGKTSAGSEQQLDFGILKLTVGLLWLYGSQAHIRGGIRMHTWQRVSLTFGSTQLALISASPVTRKLSFSPLLLTEKPACQSFTLPTNCLWLESNLTAWGGFKTTSRSISETTTRAHQASINTQWINHTLIYSSLFFFFHKKADATFKGQITVHA